MEEGPELTKEQEAEIQKEQNEIIRELLEEEEKENTLKKMKNKNKKEKKEEK
jgi:hypothetical protein